MKYCGCRVSVLYILGVTRGRSNDRSIKRCDQCTCCASYVFRVPDRAIACRTKVCGGFPSILPKSVQIFDFMKENSFVLSKHIFPKFDTRGLRFCRAEGVVVAGSPFCASWGFRVAGQPNGRSSDVTNARLVRLTFSAWPIERSVDQAM